MEIRKTFKYEMAHVVRKAYSQRCAKSIHGHSYTVEILFKNDLIEGKGLDNAGMLVDFGQIKDLINDFMDLYDHASCHWRQAEKPKFIDFFWNEFERVIIHDFPSSAEIQALMFRNVLNQILMYSHGENGFSNMVHVSKVRVHETLTGYAESSQKDCTETCDMKYVPKSTDYKHLDKDSRIAKILDKIHE